MEAVITLGQAVLFVLLLLGALSAPPRRTPVYAGRADPAGRARRWLSLSK
jgi:hypothetical protein